jgi:zinc transport system substrate-binding protein
MLSSSAARSASDVVSHNDAMILFGLHSDAFCHILGAMHYHFRQVVILAWLLVSIWPAAALAKVPVFVSIFPQRYFVEQIGREHVDVQVMVLPGASPATYEPKSRQMAAIAKAKIYFSMGVPFEAVWLEKIVAFNKNLRVVPMDHGIQKLAMASFHSHSEAEQQADGRTLSRAETETTHGKLDPHIWLSPPLVILQARHVLVALQDIDPENASAYETNFQLFVMQILALDKELRQLLEPHHGQRFMVFHPAWGYFADTYHLVQIPVEMEGKAPKPAQLKTLITDARKHRIKVLFLQPQVSAKIAEQVAREIGAQVAWVDPLAMDWAENLRDVAGKFRQAMGQ